MIRRFLYHFFWNFYDYLGTYLLLGVLAFALLGGGLWLSLSLLSGGFALLGLVFAACCLSLLALILAAFTGFSARVANGEPARWRHIWNSIRKNLKATTALTGIWGIGLIVLAINLLFYRGFTNHPWKFAGTASGILTVVLIYLAALWCIFVAVAWAAIGFEDAPTPIRTLFRRTLLYLAIVPSVWIFLFLGFGLTLILGMIFLPLLFIVLIVGLPLLSCALATVVWLAKQHIEFILQAKKELGDAHPVSAYKRRAVELGWEWEYRQPRRTLREFFKPWEQ